MKKQRDVRFTYQVLNIKLVSELRKGTDAYRQILENIYTNSIKKSTTRGKMVILRTMYPSELDGKKFFYGKISRFTNIENQDWINLTTKEIEHPDFDPNLFPNLQETDYVFVPQAHRFIIRKSPEFTVYNADDFFKKSIREVIGTEEDFSVNIEQSEDIFESIFNARSVERLLISISYTNSDDIGADATEWMDDELRDSHSQKAILQFDANPNQGINLETKLIKGALGLAVENGEVEATVYDIDNRKKKIITKKHPKEVRTVAGNEIDIKNVIFTETMATYRNGRTND
jgi:Domain of unknown function (DUF4747)